MAALTVSGRVLGTIADLFHLPDADERPDARLRALGLDTFRLVELALTLDDSLALGLTDHEEIAVAVESWVTVADVVTFAEHHAGLVDAMEGRR